MSYRNVIHEFVYESEQIDNTSYYLGCCFVSSDGDINRNIWQICKIIEDTANTNFSIRFANNNIKFDKIWNNRNTYNY